MPQVTVNGQKFYSNASIPRKGRTKARIETMKANKEIIPWADRPKAPRKPNPHKGKKCALWIDKNERVVKPPHLEASVRPAIPPKPKPQQKPNIPRGPPPKRYRPISPRPKVFKYIVNPKGPVPKWSEEDIEEYRNWSKKQRAKKK